MLNTIYVTSDDAWLRKDGANLVVEVEGAERGRAPLHMLDGVVSFGRAGASPALLAACAEAGIAVSHLAPNGRFLARVEGSRSGNVLLRRAQFRLADDAQRKAVIVRGIVAAKAANQRAVVRRALRDHGSTIAPPAYAALDSAERRLADVVELERPLLLVGPVVFARLGAWATGDARLKHDAISADARGRHLDRLIFDQRTLRS